MDLNESKSASEQPSISRTNQHQTHVHADDTAQRNADRPSPSLLAPATEPPEHPNDDNEYQHDVMELDAVDLPAIPPNNAPQRLLPAPPEFIPEIEELDEGDIEPPPQLQRVQVIASKSRRVRPLPNPAPNQPRTAPNQPHTAPNTSLTDQAPSNLPRSDATNSVAIPPTNTRNKSSYYEYLKLMQKVAEKHGHLMAAMFAWHDPGIVCLICDAEETLHGPFTSESPMVAFNYTKLRRHVITEKHVKRCSDEERKICIHLRPNGGTGAAEQQQKLMSMLNKIGLLYRYCRYNYSFLHAKDITDFIAECGGDIIDAYNNWPMERELITAMNGVQQDLDYKELTHVASVGGVGFALDGNKILHEPFKMYRARSWTVEHGQHEIYVNMCYGIKHTNNVYALHNMFTTNTALDNIDKLDLVLREVPISWSNVLALTGDGSSEIIGGKTGIFARIRLFRNAQTRGWWGLDHRFNLMIKHGFLALKIVQTHIRYMVELKEFFDAAISRQIFESLEDIEECKAYKFKPVFEIRYNFLESPLRSIQTNYVLILKTLVTCNTHKSEKASIKKLWRYWSKLSTLSLNHVLLTFATKNNYVYTNISKAGIDVISTFHYIFRWLYLIKQYKAFGIEYDKQLKAEMRKFTFKVKQSQQNGRITSTPFVYYRGFHWKCEKNKFFKYINDAAINIAAKYVKQYQHYISREEAKKYYLFNTAFDPRSFVGFARFSDIANYGNDEVRSLVDTENEETDKDGEFLHHYNEKNILKSYELSKRLLWKFRDVETVETRIGMYLHALIQAAPIYRPLIEFLQSEIVMFPTSISVERGFSVRKCISTRLRQSMTPELLQCIMRLQLNGKQLTEENRQYLRRFYLAAAITWNRMKKRNHDMQLLHDLDARTQKEEGNIMDVLRRIGK